MNDLRVLLNYIITLGAYLQLLVLKRYRHDGYKITESTAGFDVYGLSVHNRQWYYIREEQSLYEALRRTGRFV